MHRTIVRAFRRKADATGDFALTILRVARDSMDAIPPAKTAFGGALSTLEVYRRIKDTKRDAQQLLNNVAEIESAVAHSPSILHEMLNETEAIMRLCNEIRRDVQPLTSVRWRSLVRLNGNEDSIKGYRRRLNEACLSYLIAYAARTHHDVSHVKQEVSYLSWCIKALTVSIVLF